ncbi:hypothetical protein WR25_22672 [Diploscapter pachys]|uniref:Uncharacterized protein n=1 Tax=Diploscapter pachys TaxID=2018661 RepID=A0A2A2KJF6_9BILA|nr:hypothetical protein WR25_22672 [Diploscapter pachys]
MRMHNNQGVEVRVRPSRAGSSTRPPRFSGSVSTNSSTRPLTAATSISMCSRRLSRAELQGEKKCRVKYNPARPASTRVR